MIHQERSAILFMDNTTVLLINLREKKYSIFTSIVISPKNTISCLRPLDGWIIQSFKVKYRKTLMRFVLAGIAENQSPSEIASTVNILQVVQWVVKSWNAVSLKTIKNSFAKLGIAGESADCSDEHDDYFVELFNELTKEMDNIDDQISGEGHTDFGNEESTSLLDIDLDMVNWRGVHLLTLASINMLLILIC